MNPEYVYRMSIVGLLLILPWHVHAVEEIAPPSAELWQYLLEFSDEQGELMEPEILMTVTGINETELEKIANSATPVDDVNTRKLSDVKAADQVDEVQP